MGIIEKEAKKNTKSRIRELFDFLIHPDINLSTEQSSKKTLIDVLFYLVLSFLFVGIIGGIISAIFSIQNTVLSDMSADKPILRTLLIGCILIPLLEESVFRLPLRFKPLYLAIAIGIVSWVIIGQVNLLYGDSESIIYRVLCFLTAIPFGLLTFYFAKKHSEYLGIFWQNNFRFIFYASILLFGLSHVANLNISSKNIYYMRIIILPWFIGGYITGFIRIKYGFIIGVVYHGLFNLIPVLLASLK